ncbi:hypothetical protein CYMTET_21627 [Cymbomonas tetramitiformis]|uniref:Uncharacterized protein n=1 Tax=Cymbomonas tetramitiformis TaxID=36881 RepID=A0AAE0G1T0_9CHLO|nr:hypothetical protein CYMTET_21627 [Cymbomonas tetramitiformis]
MSASENVTRTAPLYTCTDIADAVFEEIEKANGNSVSAELTDKHLLCLATICEEKHLQRALQLVDQGGVRCLMAEKSGRTIFQVLGRSTV